MIKLLVVADDFTGALDTGVQFSQQGVQTLVTTDVDIDFSGVDDYIDVLVIDTETRHKCGDEAYRIVYKIIANATRCDIRHVYKKTDSVLRGNIGSELLAALDGSGSDKLMFVPSYPDNDRTTDGGVQYVSGVPIAQSPFSGDLFSPIENSYIPDIIRQHAELETVIVKRDDTPDFDFEHGVFIFDAKTNDDLVNIGHLLKKFKRLSLTAGCAGFAGVLCDVMDFEKHPQVSAESGDNILIVSGSINSISIEQMRHAKNAGYEGFSLIPSQKLSCDYSCSPYCNNLVESLKGILLNNKLAYIEAAESDSGIFDADIVQADRLQVAENIGKIVKRVLDDFPVDNLFVFGGDTLFGIMVQLGVDVVMPVCEVSPGIALSRVLSNKYSFNLISKSGGFGSVDAASVVAERLLR